MPPAMLTTSGGSNPVRRASVPRSVPEETKQRIRGEYEAERAERGVEHGSCFCGCGNKTPLARQTTVKTAHLSGEPLRYLPGHNARTKPLEQLANEHKTHWANAYPGIPYGLCCCGCGHETEIARRTNGPRGWVAGEPKPFFRAHSKRLSTEHEPNPSALCMCGCGQFTSIATRSSVRQGMVFGKPMKYVRGHNSKLAHEYREREQQAIAYRDRWTRQRPDIPYGCCWCTCGSQTPLAQRTSKEFDHVAGEPVRYCLGHNNTNALTQEYEVEHRGYETPCWIWQGFLLSSGYALKQVAGRRLPAHRWYYETANGSIPFGLHLHHLCEVGACVNPDHLLPVTVKEHMRLHRLLRQGEQLTLPE